MSSMTLLSTLPFVAVLIIGLMDDVTCLGNGFSHQHSRRQGRGYDDDGPMDDYDQSGNTGQYNGHDQYNPRYGSNQRQNSFRGNGGGSGQSRRDPNFMYQNDHSRRRTQSLPNMGMHDDSQLYEHFGCNENNADTVCRQNCRKNIPGYTVSCHPIDRINRKLIPVQSCLCLRVPLNERSGQGGISSNRNSYSGDQGGFRGRNGMNDNRGNNGRYGQDPYNEGHHSGMYNRDPTNQMHGGRMHGDTQGYDTK